MTEQERNLLILLAVIVRDRLTEKYEADGGGDTFDKADLDALDECITAITGRTRPWEKQ